MKRKEPKEDMYNKLAAVIRDPSLVEHYLQQADQHFYFAWGVIWGKEANATLADISEFYDWNTNYRWAPALNSFLEQDDAKKGILAYGTFSMFCAVYTVLLAAVGWGFYQSQARVLTQARPT